jgi:hypothetical protein
LNDSVLREPGKAATIEELLNRLDSIKAKRADLDRSEKETLELLRDKLKDQKQRIQKLGVGMTGDGSLQLTPVSAQWADESEDRAVRTIETLGGKVTRDERAPGKPVVGVILTGMAVTDSTLKELVALKQLKTVNLNKTRVTDGGLQQLQKALPDCHITR